MYTYTSCVHTLVICSHVTHQGHVPIITVELGRERSCSGPVPTGRIRRELAVKKLSIIQYNMRFKHILFCEKTSILNNANLYYKWTECEGDIYIRPQLAFLFLRAGSSLGQNLD